MSKFTEKKKVSLQVAEERIYSLRVTELQGFLNAMGLNKIGRKEELRSKAVTFLRNAAQSGKLEQVFAKVEEFYHRRFPPSTAPRRPPSSTLVPASSLLPTHSFRAVNATNVDVRFKVLPFHDKIETLVKPRILPQVDPRIAPLSQSMTQSITLEIAFTPAQISKIQAGERRMPVPQSSDGVVKFLTEVLLRFAPCELSCEQDDQYPPRVTVVVNRNPVPLPSYQPLKNTGEHRKHGQPVDITRYMLLHRRNAVQITCHPTPDITRKYVVAVELCSKRTSAELLEKVKTRVRSADVCKAFIKEKLSGGDADMEIATTSLRISLNCPLGKTRILYPGRSSHCTHAQCFDLVNFLQMNELKARWVCPVCDCPAVFDSLLVDGLMEEVLKKCAPGVEHVEFLSDGSWAPYQQRKASKPATGNSAPVSTNAEASVSVNPVFDLCGSASSLGDDAEDGEADDGAAPTHQPDVIDLTLDSDSEDDTSTPPPAVAAPLSSLSLLSSVAAQASSVESSAASVPVSSGVVSGRSDVASYLLPPSTASNTPLADNVESAPSCGLDMESAGDVDSSLLARPYNCPPLTSLSNTGTATGSSSGPRGTQAPGTSRPPSNISSYSFPDFTQTSSWPDQSAVPSTGEPLMWPYETIPGLGMGPSMSLDLSSTSLQPSFHPYGTSEVPPSYADNPASRGPLYASGVSSSSLYPLSYPLSHHAPQDNSAQNYYTPGPHHHFDDGSQGSSNPNSYL